MKIFAHAWKIFLCAFLAAVFSTIESRALTSPLNVTFSDGMLTNYAPGSDLGLIAGRPDLRAASVYSWMVSDVTAFNALPVVNLPQPTTRPDGSPFATDLFSSTSLAIDLDGSYDYLFMFWDDNGTIGSIQAFYVGGLVGEETFNDPLSGVGITRVSDSLIDVFGPIHLVASVPEAGGTLPLISAALIGLGLFAARHSSR